MKSAQNGLSPGHRQVGDAILIKISRFKSEKTLTKDTVFLNTKNSQIPNVKKTLRIAQNIKKTPRILLTLDALVYI